MVQACLKKLSLQLLEKTPFKSQPDSDILVMRGMALEETSAEISRIFLKTSWRKLTIDTDMGHWRVCYL